MPSLSLYRPQRSYDYKYFDEIISQQFIAGGTDLYIHKYILESDTTTVGTNTLNIEDVIFLENRDRKYEPDIIRLRGHYNVQNTDFDLSQFGLFLTNDVIFITVHHNDMIDVVGRKLMVGDVVELPHLVDDFPISQAVPFALRRFYQVTDANYASEGFSQTWYPHLWRIKCEPLTDSQEFKDILSQPENKDNYLGNWEATKTYPQGYVITFGDKNYTAKKDVPINVPPPNDEYWQLDTATTLQDTISSYQRNIEINDAALQEARNNMLLSGYDNSMLYVVPTYDEVEQARFNQPAPPTNLLTTSGAPTILTGAVVLMRSPTYKKPSVAIRIPKATVMSIWDMTADMAGDIGNKLDKFIQLSLETMELEPEKTSSGSGSVETTKVLAVQAIGPVTGPYGTADNTYATADQDPTATGFTGTISSTMDYRADCDPRYQFIARVSPRSFGYSTGYLVGTGAAPNGFPVRSGISFPLNPANGDYFLRIDYAPQLLYRWNGKIWVRISENVRTLHLEFTEQNTSQKSGFINNTKKTTLSDGTQIDQRQALSKVLKIQPD